MAVLIDETEAEEIGEYLRDVVNDGGDTEYGRGAAKILK